MAHISTDIHKRSWILSKYIYKKKYIYVTEKIKNFIHSRRGLNFNNITCEFNFKKKKKK